MMEYLDKLYLTLAMHVQNFIEEEKGAVDLITIVILIGIAVVLAVLFREKMQDLVEELLDGAIDGAREATSG